MQSYIHRIAEPCAGLAELPYDPAAPSTRTVWQFDRMGDGIPTQHFGNKVASWEVVDMAGRVYQGAWCKIDHTSHHYRASIGRDANGRAVALYVQQYHGGGHSAWSFGGEMPLVFDSIADETARYLLADNAIKAIEDARAAAKHAEAKIWTNAAATNRIRSRTYPARGIRKVWIEPEREEGESDANFAARKRYASPRG